MRELDEIWEFAIKIPKKDRWSCIQTLRSKVQPVITFLKDHDVKWYCFLVHGNQNGVPIPDYDGYQYHVRFQMPLDHEQTLEIDSTLPGYCICLRESVPLEKISGLDESLYIDGATDTGWYILYWQCEWVYSFLQYHKKLTLHQIAQFLHFFANIFQMGLA